MLLNVEDNTCKIDCLCLEVYHVWISQRTVSFLALPWMDLYEWQTAACIAYKRRVMHIRLLRPLLDRGNEPHYHNWTMAQTPWVFSWMKSYFLPSWLIVSTAHALKNTVSPTFSFDFTSGPKPMTLPTSIAVFSEEVLSAPTWGSLISRYILLPNGVI